MIDFGSFIKDIIVVDGEEVPGGNVAKYFILLGPGVIAALPLPFFWIERVSTEGDGTALVTALDDVKIAAMKTVDIFLRYFIVRSNFLL